MAVPQNNNQKNFTEKFNKRLGRHTGRPLKETDFSKTKNWNAARTGKTGEAKGGSKTSKKPGIKSEAKIADNYRNIEIIRQILQNDGFLEKQSGGGGIGGFLTRHVVDPVKDLSPISGNPGAAIGRITDVAGRPLNALAEGTRRYISDAADEGNPFTPLDDVATGVREGITGKRKTGFFDVNRQLLEDLEHIPNPSVFPAREYIQQILAPSGTPDEEHRTPLVKAVQNAADIEAGEQPRHVITPEDQEAINQDLGSLRWLSLSQDVILDPTNLAGTGLIKPFRAAAETVDETGKVIKGIEATRNATARAVTKALDETAPLKTARTTVAESAAPLKDTATGKFTKVNPRQIIQEIAAQTADDINLDISGGQQRWKSIANGNMEYQVIADRAAIQKRAELLSDFETDFTKIVDAKIKNPSGSSVGLVNKLAAKNPMIKRLVDEALELQKAVLTDPKALKKLNSPEGVSKISDTIWREAAANVRSSVDLDVADFRTKVADELNSSLTKKGGIQIGDKAVSVGGKKMWAKIDALGDTIGNSTLGKAFSFERNFPGLSGQIASGSRTMGLRLAEDMRDQFLSEFPKLSIKDEKLLQKATREGIELSGKLGEAQLVLRNWYQRVGNLLVDSGLARAEDIKNPNYVFEWFRGKTDDINDAKATRKKLIRSGDLDWGKKLDASPEGRKVPKKMSGMASQNMIFYIQDTMKKLVKQEMRNRMIQMYGVKATDLSETAMKEMGLKIVPKSWLDNNLLKELELTNKGNADWYLDSEAFKVLDHFNKWTRNGFSPEGQVLVRNLDKLTNFVKKYNTIYFPSFQIRNAVGDFLTGFMDGVRMPDWEEVASKWLKSAKDPDVLVDLGTSDPQLFLRFKKAYDDHAGSAGFFRADLPLSRRPLYKKGGAIDETIRRGSEGREDLGRMAHFLHAMRDEYPAALGKYKSELQAWDKASQAAAYRVNRYHADYGALTPFEQNVMRRAVPFYTYSRRMLPVMVEAMFFNPAFYTLPNKLIKNLSESLIPEEERTPDWYKYPEWMREIGYAPFNDGANPWGIAINALLPTNLTGTWMDSENLPKQVLSQTNPLASMIMDYAYGTDLYSGEQVGSSTDLIGGMLRPYSTYKSLQNPTVSNIEKVLRTGLGLPIYEITGARKKSADIENQAETRIGIEEKINDMIKDLGYNIYLSNQNSGQKIKIVHKNSAGETTNVLYEGIDMKEAAKILERIINGN